MRLQRDALLAFGATLAGVGIVLCIGEGGGHPLGKLWFLVGIACLIIGFGVLLSAAPDRSPVSVPHDQRLRMMLGGGRSSNESESGCRFADPARDAAEGGSEEFRRHFRRLTKHLAPWNATTTRHYTARKALLAKLASEIEDQVPGAPIYRADVIVKNLSWIIMGRALNDRLSDPLSFGVDATGEVWTGAAVVKLPPADGLRLARDHDWAISMLGVPEGPHYECEFESRTRPVKGLLTEALQWAETVEVRDSYRELLAFDREPLLREIAELEATPQFRRRSGCRTCRGS
jgi:hypothetical protein